MPELLSHPTREELSAYSLGQLPPERAVVIDGHISECRPCCETIAGISSDDTFIGLLQEARQLPTAQTTEQGKLAAARSSLHDVPAPLVEHPRYEIVGLIGRGGMGDVYQARHRKMERTVALKVINRRLVRKTEAMHRFHREVKAAAQLSHPNIVTAYDADQADDCHFMVMEYVDGVDLSQAITERGALPVVEACDYIRQAAMGLQHAYEQGMVHRDIKPHNLMVLVDGTVKVLDFGLATLAPEAASDPATVEGPSDLTGVGAIMGTPDFISPEQADDARQADIRSDIYSLGTTLYFLLSGQPPFAGGSVMHKLNSHAQVEPESLEFRRDDIPAELATVISKMMAKSPDERYQTPVEVGEALEPFASRMQRRSQPNAPLGRQRRRVLPIVAVATLFIATILAAIVYYIQTDKGTVRVAVFDESLAVDIRGQTITMNDGNQKPIEIRAGEHTLMVRQIGSDFEFETGNFQMRRDGEVSIKVEMIQGGIVVTSDGTRIGKAKLPIVEGSTDGVKRGQEEPPRRAVDQMLAQAAEPAADVSRTGQSAESDVSAKRKTTAFLVEAVQRGDVEAVKAAFSAGVAPNSPSNPLIDLLTAKQLTALHWAVTRRISDGETIEPSPEIAKLLIEAGADVNAADYLGQTPLEWAAKFAPPDVVQMLIKAGADVNAESRYGTVLMAGTRIEIAKQLIEAGADVNAGESTSPLANAAKYGNVELIRLLVKNGAKVNDPQNPPIHWAGTPEAAKALLEAGADVNQRNAKGETALHLAKSTWSPNAETVKLLIEAGADVEAKTATGSTPLHTALLAGQSEIAAQLIAAGADVDAKDKEGNTPLSAAHEALSWARGIANVDHKPYENAVELLVKAGAKDDGRTKLQQAVAAGNLQQVEKLIASKVDVNETGPKRITAAHIASEKGHTQILAALIEADAEVDKPDAYRMRPLHFAASAEVAQLLIDNGAKVNSGMLSPLYMATMNGKADVVRELVRREAVVNDVDCGEILNWATFAGQQEVVEVLFELRDADALLKTPTTYSPLHVAANGTYGDMNSPARVTPQQRLSIARFLVQKGADVNARWGGNLNPLSGAAHMVDTTPLMFAASVGDSEMVKFLLDQKADVSATNASGQTALHFAAKSGHHSVVELLLTAKANVNALTVEAKTPLDLAQDAAVKVLLIQKGAKTASEVLKDTKR